MVLYFSQSLTLSNIKQSENLRDLLLKPLGKIWAYISKPFTHTWLNNNLLKC